MLLMATRPGKYFPLPPTKSLCSLTKVENNRIAVREVRLWLVISWFKSTHSIRDVMLLQLVLLCLYRPFLLNFIFKVEEVYWILMLHEAAFKFYVFKGKLIYESIWSHNCHKLPAGNFARLINTHFTRGKVKWVVKLYLWCFYCDYY